jgi:2-polyprenyl-3-methyl-5-hydroxy-6-metoxy-1,4-benzoquinol methylase
MDDQQQNETIMNNDDVLDMLDDLLQKWDAKWWNEFWTNQEKNAPFMVDLPDENLVQYVTHRDLTRGKALDIGCGNGRNSRYLAKMGFQVDAVDFSAKSIETAKKYPNNESVNYINLPFKDIKMAPGEYDFIYDSGCLHHIKPHRRAQYIKKMFNLLKPGGYLGLVCFNESGGANVSDIEVYHQKSMAGGLGYSEAKLKKVLVPYFEVINFRTMKDGEDNETFGLPTMWAVLLHKNIGH